MSTEDVAAVTRQAAGYILIDRSDPQRFSAAANFLDEQTLEGNLFRQEFGRDANFLFWRAVIWRFCPTRDFRLAWAVARNHPGATPALEAKHRLEIARCAYAQGNLELARHMATKSRELFGASIDATVAEELAALDR